MNRFIETILAQRLLPHPRDESLGHLEIDIRIEQCQPHLAQRLADILLGNLAQPAQVLESLLQFATQRIKHGRAS